MNLRCLVCSSDEDTAAPICQVLAELGAEAEHCLEAATAAPRIATEAFQIVVVDWDQQAEAELILKAARARKPNERPLTLAIVSDDTKFPKALQAGANSILRKPILVNQVRDTLQSARSLLKARQGSSLAMAASAAASPTTFPVEVPPNDAHLRAGEFLQSGGPTPATQIDAESEMEKSIEQSAAAEIKPVKDLEPTAAAVSPDVPAASPADAEEPRGLEWYLKKRGVASPFVVSHTEVQTAAPAPQKPELLGYEQSPTPASKPLNSEKSQAASVSGEDAAREQKAEAELFSYITDGAPESPRESGGGLRLGKGAILFAAVLAAGAIAAAPQAPWHPQIAGIWTHGRQAIHAWLNPQPVAPPQTPPTHENFGRAGDEYKLPVAEAIPDATTDPSQIRVTPVIDPTAKKPNAAASGDPNAAPADATPPTADPSQQTTDPSATTTAPTATQGNPPAPGTTAPVVAPGPNNATAPAPVAPPKVTPVVVAETSHPDPFVNTGTTNSAPVQPATVRNSQPRPVSPSPNTHIPSSLQSQMASMAPEAGGNKSPDTSLPSIEPVAVPEAAERSLLNTQPSIAYPASAKGQQGTVVLQVLIGREGTVQDAKFLQGSLAFARAAIDGVKQWTFKPYSMNGRPVSVQTKLTLSFRPGQ